MKSHISYHIDIIIRYLIKKLNNKYSIIKIIKKIHIN